MKYRSFLILATIALVALPVLGTLVDDGRDPEPRRLVRVQTDAPPMRY